MKALWRTYTSTGDPSLLAAASLLLDVVEGRLRDWAHGEMMYEVRGWEQVGGGDVLSGGAHHSM
jgi:hypothetical protein